MKTSYSFFTSALLGLWLGLPAWQAAQAQTQTQVVLHSCRPENPAHTAADLVSTQPAHAAKTQPLAAGPEVRLIYLVPSDRTINPAYAEAIANAGHHLQRWYQDQLGNTKTFNLHSPVAETYQTTHPAAWYQTNPNGSTFAQFYFNAAQDAFAAAGGGSYNNPDFVYAIYIDAESACGQCGGCGGSGVLVVSSNDLKGLVGQPSIRYCPTDAAPVQYPPCRWVGGLGHELGHAFGLPHPPGCDTGLGTCDSNDLMWLGYISYPNTYLRASEQATLNQSAFFTPHSPASAPASCDKLLATQALATAQPLTLSPNPAHGRTQLRLPTPLSASTGLVLFDALGRAVQRYDLRPGTTEATLDLAGLPAGLYVLRYGTTSQKLVVD